MSDTRRYNDETFSWLQFFALNKKLFNMEVELGYSKRHIRYLKYILEDIS